MTFHASDFLGGLFDGNTSSPPPEEIGQVPLEAVAAPVLTVVTEPVRDPAAGPAVMTTNIITAPAPEPVTEPAMPEIVMAPIEPAADYSAERSRLFLTDPAAFFAGWKQDGSTWNAPGGGQPQQVEWWDGKVGLWENAFFYLNKALA
jgi:hypothetical protein